MGNVFVVFFAPVRIRVVCLLFPASPGQEKLQVIDSLSTLISSMLTPFPIVAVKDFSKNV